MVLSNPLVLLTGFLCVILSPAVALFSLAIYRAAKRPAENADPRLPQRVRQLEQEKQELEALWERTQIQTNQMIDRVRLLERLLIEERRQRLAENSETLRKRAA